MDVLSTDSLEILRRKSKSNPELVELDFETLQKEFDLVMVPLKSNIGSLVALEFPEGRQRDQNKDLETASCSVNHSQAYL